MKSKIILYGFLGLLAFYGIMFTAGKIMGQSTLTGTTGSPAPTLSGTGAPGPDWACNAVSLNVIYIQTDATNGRIWLCDTSTGSAAWDHLLNTVIGTGTTGTFGSQSYVLGGCTSTLTVTVAGAVVGTNSATASPVFATAPSGNTALLNVTAWISAANTVSVQGCSFGILGTQPAFTAKVLVY